MAVEGEGEGEGWWSWGREGESEYWKVGDGGNGVEGRWEERRLETGSER